MDPVTAFIAIVWAFNAGAALVIIGHKLEKYNKMLDEINDSLNKCDFSWRMPELEELDKEHRDGEKA